MADRRFIDAALDPALIPGVYNMCDQWCDYCPVTSRCLAFKCRPPFVDTRGPYEDIANAMKASMTFLKDCHEAEGLEPPAELLHLIKNIGVRPPFKVIDDPLEQLARRYAVLSTAFLVSPSGIPERLPRRPDGPTPHDVFLYYHALIGIKIYRALASASEAARSGNPAAVRDARCSAKVALVGIDRSDEALQVMALDDADPRIEQLRGELRQLRGDVERRFPDARGFLRSGLDGP